MTSEKLKNRSKKLTDKNAVTSASLLGGSTSKPVNVSPLGNMQLNELYLLPSTRYEYNHPEGTGA